MTAIGRLLMDFSRRRRPLRSLGASGQLGYGIPTPALEAGLARAPDMIGVDMGSIDIGPAYLGGGKMAPTRIGAKRDLRKVLRAARRLDIPLVVGSAGARPHLDQTLETIREIAHEDSLAFRVVASDMPRAEVKQAIVARRVRPMDTMPRLTDADVDAATYIVGQLGLEGATMIGHRSLLLAGVADPRFIARHGEIFAAVSHVVRDLVCEDAREDYRLGFRLYGVDGVRTWADPPVPMPREAFVLGECIAPTREQAEEVIRTAKQYLLHHGYEGRLATAGNLAFPFTPPEVVIGEAYRFNVFHLMEIDDMSRLFPVEVEAVGR